MNSKDRLIYTDPSTSKVMIKDSPIEGIKDVRVFIEKHIKNNITSAMSANLNLKKKPSSNGVFPPKYILKMVSKDGSAQTHVYYCKSQLFEDLIESWGTCDLIIQQFVK